MFFSWGVPLDPPLDLLLLLLLLSCGCLDLRCLSFEKNVGSSFDEFVWFHKVYGMRSGKLYYEIKLTPLNHRSE